MDCSDFYTWNADISFTFYITIQFLIHSQRRIFTSVQMNNRYSFSELCDTHTYTSVLSDGEFCSVNVCEMYTAAI